MVDAAKLDRQIVIESASSTQDDYGQNTPQTWSTFATVWAGKNKDIRTRNKETFQANQLVAERQDYFEIRYLSGIDEAMRIVDENSKIYDIISIEELGRREAMRIFAINKDRTQEGN
ncbi:phage head closure protein [Chondrinema litorale]|uniref:phage head closure protein n=1 Tax=Chondrinema litorale TaxID=2994555 RepID=UPI00254291D1|nr:phage head closure protein [Chondrinema litorale]UZS00264.1 phage head closure protein [Chondrinema litorale]